MDESALVFLPIVLPLGMACVGWVWGAGARLGLFTGVTLVGCALALAHRLWRSGPFRYPVGGWGAPLGIELGVDWPAVVFLLLSAVVGLGVSVHARGYFAGGKSGSFFWPLWLVLWGGLGALALSADVFTLYVTLELVGLSAVALVSLGHGPQAAAASVRYILVSVVGALGYLLAVALLYAQYGVLDLELLSRVIQPSPATWTALGLTVASLGLKAAVLPLHGWLPPAHANAPAPGSAILSALVVKAAFFVLLRLLLVMFPAVRSPVLDLVLASLGAAAIVGGSLLAFRQRRLKRVVAYSTVAQLGYLFLAFGLGPLTAKALWGVLFFAVAHGLAKSALFLAAGNVHYALGHDRLAKFQGAAGALPTSFFTIGLAAVSLSGLPPSGGFIAKWALVQVAMEQGRWEMVVLFLGGGLLAAGYLLRIVEAALLKSDTLLEVKRPARWMDLSALALALCALLLGWVPTPEGP